MISKNVKVQAELKEEDRPIAFLVQMASQFESRILFEAGDKQVNVKSIMGMMTLELPVGEQVIVMAEGEDEEKAVSDIEKYLSNN